MDDRRRLQRSISFNNTIADRPVLIVVNTAQPNPATEVGWKSNRKYPRSPHQHQPIPTDTSACGVNFGDGSPVPPLSDAISFMILILPAMLLERKRSRKQICRRWGIVHEQLSTHNPESARYNGTEVRVHTGFQVLIAVSATRQYHGCRSNRVRRIEAAFTLPSTEFEKTCRLADITSS